MPGEYSNPAADAQELVQAASAKAAGAGFKIGIKPMRLADGRCDYFVAFTCEGREVTPHVFRERFKAEYHVALYRWLIEGGEEPSIMDFDEGDWPSRTFTEEERRAFAALAAPGPASEPSAWRCVFKDHRFTTHKRETMERARERGARIYPLAYIEDVPER